MKNKYKIYLFLAFTYLNISSILLANEFTFTTPEIKITDNGNIIEAINGEANSLDGDMQIIAEKFNYNRNKSILDAKSNATAILKSRDIKIKADNISYMEKTSILNAEGNANVTDFKKNIEIKGDKIEYNKSTSVFNAIGNVILKDLTINTVITSQNIYFDDKNQMIKSDTETVIEDNLGNRFFTQGFLFNKKRNTIKINNSKLIDYEKNIYQLSSGFINLNSNKFIGKDISMDFNNQYFDKDNEPRLKGNSISSDKNTTIINKGVFTTCKKNDDCPPWQMSAKKISHDKNKKIIYYDNAWLKLYDKPVLYFPKFFHPDPTVKRQSGFLMPSFSDSTSLGSSFNIPYYKVISTNKDLTFRPRMYSDERILMQTEYRQVNKNFDHVVDFSFMNDNNPSKNHLFSKSTAKINFYDFEETEVKLEIQQVSNDTYLETYKLESPIINNTNLLTSSLELETYREDLTFNSSFQVFEDLNLPNSDRYEFIYPSYLLSKRFDEDIELDGLLSLNSSGFIKNYNTNIYERVVINDLIFNTNPKINNSGLRSNFDFLIKNVNSDSTKSKKYKEDSSHKVVSLMQYNLSYPLLRKRESYIDKFKPLMAIKFSPNNTKNIKGEDRRLDVANIYSLNRIGTNDNVEEGTSLTYGFEYVKTNNANNDILQASLANVLRVDKSENLPNQSGLGNKTSDIVGNFTYDPNETWKLNYDFSLDSNLNDINYQLINTEFKINNFVTSFEYLNENKTNNSASYITNKTAYYLDETKNFAFETRENKKTGLTEFYNLIYQYRNDCLIAAIEYNKDYYSDRELQPDENVFFKLTIIPFGETSTTNLLK